MNPAAVLCSKPQHLRFLPILSGIPTLILPSRRLTRLKLIQIPPTNRQAPLILIHALAEIVHVRRTRPTLRHLR